MNLIEFELYIEQQFKPFLNRCNLINEIMTTDADWSYVLRALLFCSNDRVVSKSYMLEKISFMLNNPDNMESFLDYTRMCVYIAIRIYLEK